MIVKPHDDGGPPGVLTPARLREVLAGRRVTELEYFPADHDAPEMLLLRLDDGVIVALSPAPAPDRAEGSSVASLCFSVRDHDDDPLGDVRSADLLDARVEERDGVIDRVVLSPAAGTPLDVRAVALEIVDPVDAHLHAVRVCGGASGPGARA